LIEHGKFKIFIMASPQDDNSAAYIKELKSLGVTDVVRTCEPTYLPEKFEREGIRVHELMFADGAAPPDEVVKCWNDLVRERYNPKNSTESGIVAVHCVAGLGRAPLMAAIALIEITGLDYMDAVEKIRENRKGAINKAQLQYLQAYKRTTPSNAGCCSVM
jgi:protein tyrosine phosphatase type 4A